MGTVLIHCPCCQAHLTASEEFVGKRARCKGCGETFLIEAPSLEDSVASWLGDLPPGADETQSSRGASATTTAAPGAWPAKPHPPRSGALAGGKTHTPEASAPADRLLRLSHLDQMGAFFIFPASLLANEQFRASMPRCCLNCGSANNLTVHLIVWNAKLPERLRTKGQSLRVRVTQEELVHLGGPELVRHLPAVPDMPSPFDLPMPYFICNICAPTGAVMTHIRPREDGTEECELGISSMKRAAEFLAHNLGRDHEDYKRLLSETEKRLNDPWRALPLAVRNRIGQWYTAGQDERFISYIQDMDFAKAESGMGGLVLTNRRLIFHKLGAHREVPLKERIELRVHEQENKYQLAINVTGAKPMLLHCDPGAVDQIRKTLRAAGSLYTFKA